MVAARLSTTPLIARMPMRRWSWFLIAVVAIAVLPLVLQDSYWRTNLIVCALNVILAVSLDFVLGYAGQLNLGHAAFYGIGAYASTLLVMDLGVPFWAAFVLGAMVVMAEGTDIASGGMRELRANPSVVDAYLGEVVTSA